MKQDNSDLVKKIFVLEELLRDSELSHIQTKEEEAARRKDLEKKLSLERKKNEDFAARIEYLEEENTSLEEKSNQLDKQLSNLLSENQDLSVKVSELSELELENSHHKQDLYFLQVEKSLDEVGRELFLYIPKFYFPYRPSQTHSRG